MEKIKIEQTGACGFFVWCAGWLFTIGFLQLSFFKGALAVLVWPYYLGVHFGGF